MKIVDISPAGEQHAALRASLSTWYDGHPAVRRMLAIHALDACRVFVTLEPTFDGDDTLPIWLANRNDWESDLQSLVDRDLQLRMIGATAIEDLHVGDADAVMIADLSWRDPWAF